MPLLIPPLTPEVAAWFRRAILGAHYSPQASAYDPLPAEDEANYVRGVCSAAISAVRAQMLAAGELERTEETPNTGAGWIRVGPAAPRHPNG